MKRLRITVEGKTYNVTVEVLEEAAQPTSALAAVHTAEISTPAATAPARTSSTNSQGQLLSPLAGKVIAVNVAKGQQVAAGVPLITLEAMKMNTYVFAPHAGVVLDVLVEAGDAVEEEQPLLKLS